MEAGTSWEGVRWRAGQGVVPFEPRARLRLGIASLLLALLVSMSAVLAFAAPAGAVTCSTIAHNPWKVDFDSLRGNADLFCNRSGTFKNLEMGVYRNINNFPDPQVCYKQYAKSSGDHIDLTCTGTFGNDGYFYTWAHGGGGTDYSQFIYFNR